MTSADIGLGLWHIVADGRNISTGFLKNQRSALACHKAFVAKEVEDDMTSRKYIWQAICQTPLKLSAWRLMGISLLGKRRHFLKKYKFGCDNRRLFK